MATGTTNDSTQDLTRAATYGNAPNDDCPSWSDYTCSILNSDGSSSTLTAIASATPVAPMRKRVAANATKNTHVKQKMPKHVAGTRGSKYVHSKCPHHCSLPFASFLIELIVR